MERYILRNYGYFLAGLAGGDFAPSDAAHVLLRAMLRGEATASTEAAVAWRKYVRHVGK